MARTGDVDAATARYAGAKILGAFGSLCFMLVVNFFLFRVLPGDPARTLGRGRLSTEAQLEAFNAKYGLEEPLGQQFLTFLNNTVHGDLGYSTLYHRDVSGILLERLWPTLLLVGTSTLFAALIGVWLGTRAGVEARQAVRQGLDGRARLTLYSMPEWWLGLVLIAVFAVGAGPLPGLFPTGRLHSVGRGSVVARGRPGHDLAPRAAGPDAHPGLSGRLRADHARVAARRDRVGLPDHGAGQGAA